MRNKHTGSSFDKFLRDENIQIKCIEADPKPLFVQSSQIRFKLVASKIIGIDGELTRIYRIRN